MWWCLIICLPTCHGNVIATCCSTLIGWIVERFRLNQYKVAGRRISVRLYILLTWPYFCYMVLGISSRRSPSGFVRFDRIVCDRPIPYNYSASALWTDELELLERNRRAVHKSRVVCVWERGSASQCGYLDVFFRPWVEYAGNVAFVVYCDKKPSVKKYIKKNWKPYK